MKACIYRRFGAPSVLEIGEVDAPERRANFVRVAVHAAALNPKDVLLRKGKMRLLGTRLPMIPGYDIAGVLLDDADDLKAGTEIFGMIQSHQGGGCAEVARLPVNLVARKPESLTMTEAASIPLASLTAFQALRDDLGVQQGQHVLLNGASGGVGTLAVQIAKVMGATVTAVCSGSNESLVKSLGADRVIDYTKQVPTNEHNLDHVFDIYGSLPWKKAKPMLKPAGRYCTAIPKADTIVRAGLQRLGLHRAAMVMVQSRRRDLEQVCSWIDAGKIKPVIDRTLPLDEASEGHKHLETRRARGKVVLKIR
ncbi:MAG: NAD(P)-dependent alcohol dehydrogenase [Myxococcota bacterium]